MNEYLLNDEESISKEDLECRDYLYREFMKLPKEFVGKMRHLQPQIGCFNNCGFCSKFSVCKSEYWSEASLRNVISALKKTAKNYTNGDVLLAYDRFEHRVGVIFPYLNNDAASYPYLDRYIDLCYKELGARTRISTVSFSRHNKELNEMHKRISKNLLYALAGVRLSISQYGRVWEEPNKGNSLEEYKLDLVNFLKIYKPYYDKFGSGPRKMCCEIRFDPLVENAPVYETLVDGHYVVAVGNYLFVSKDKNIDFKISYIADPYCHSISLSEEPIIFNEYSINSKVHSRRDIEKIVKNKDYEFVREQEGYKLENKDGYYYSFDPKIKDDGNYGFNVYPKVGVRKKSGYIVTERFLLNAIYKFKKTKGLNLRGIYVNSTFNDVNEVVSYLYQEVKYYEEHNKLDKSKYIMEHVIPIVSMYVDVLKMAGYDSDLFFDSKFTIDTGIICNLGRAITYFKGLTNYINEPMTPTHERNYGRHLSTMTEENSVWMLACGFHDNLVIEKLDLNRTASVEGQTSYRETIKLDGFNKKIREDEKYLFPGANE